MPARTPRLNGEPSYFFGSIAHIFSFVPWRCHDIAAPGQELIGPYHVKRFGSTKLLHGCLVSDRVNAEGVERAAPLSAPIPMVLCTCIRASAESVFPRFSASRRTPPPRRATLYDRGNIVLIPDPVSCGQFVIDCARHTRWNSRMA